MSDKITNLPSDTNERKRLLAAVNEAVGLKVEMNSAKEAIADIRDVQKEKGYCTTFFNKLVEAVYDEQYNANDKKKKLEETLEVFEEASILQGK